MGFLVTPQSLFTYLKESKSDMVLRECHKTVSKVCLANSVKLLESCLGFTNLSNLNRLRVKNRQIEPWEHWSSYGVDQRIRRCISFFLQQLRTSTWALGSVGLTNIKQNYGLTCQSLQSTRSSRHSLYVEYGNWIVLELCITKAAF